MWGQGPNFTADDIYLFNEGRQFQLYKILGAHTGTYEGKSGVKFAVWAPNAKAVSVVGDFNGWQAGRDPLQALEASGLWYGFISQIDKGSRYKYHIESRFDNYCVDKADPFAFYGEHTPQNASLIWDLAYEWQDRAWMDKRHDLQKLDAPWSIYEMHLGSWRRHGMPGGPERFLSYRELAVELPAYVRNLGFTHVEFLPLMEHPFYGSWGYQTTSYFAPSSRYGTPQDFMHLIDCLHQAGVGVILDWVPSHFPSDEFGLAFFDGTWLFEHQDKRLGYHPDWNSLIFNYGRNEVKSFLISSALFWLQHYHIDALRVDAVASMLYLDYSRPAGGWIPNQFGGRENLEAIAFLKTLNEAVYQHFPDVQTIAEESTAWPMVSRPTYLGGLGFGMKWDMGWMHDSLAYFKTDPIHRRYEHDKLTFRAMYAHTENFVLPLSHDEVVYGKGSLLGNMPGDMWQKFANLRSLLTYMFATPGKKLLFMGSELAPWEEWSHERSLPWELGAEPPRQGISLLVKDLNTLYRREPALHQGDCLPEGFSWLDHADAEFSVISFIRHAIDAQAGQDVLVVFNLTPLPRFNYRLGVEAEGTYYEVLNSDATAYGGSGHGNMGRLESSPIASHGRPFSLNLTLPPLAALFIKWGKHAGSSAHDGTVAKA